MSRVTRFTAAQWCALLLACGDRHPEVPLLARHPAGAPAERAAALRRARSQLEALGVSRDGDIAPEWHAAVRLLTRPDAWLYGLWYPDEQAPPERLLGGRDADRAAVAHQRDDTTTVTIVPADRLAITLVEQLPARQPDPGADVLAPAPALDEEPDDQASATDNPLRRGRRVRSDVDRCIARARRLLAEQPLGAGQLGAFVRIGAAPRRAPEPVRVWDVDAGRRLGVVRLRSGTRWYDIRAGSSEAIAVELDDQLDALVTDGRARR